jgi:MoxR-like ATPase
MKSACSSKLEGSYEKVNQVVSVEQILRAQRVREVYMDEKSKIHYMCFATRYPEKYKLADLKPLISFGAFA